MAMAFMNFWKDAKRTQVTWRPGDPRLAALIAESRFPGLYALVLGDRVLKVGEAGIVRNGKQGTVGERLKKHLDDGCTPASGSYRNYFPSWWEFSGALVGRALTMYTLRDDVPTADPKEADKRRRAVEKEAIRQASDPARGGVLWEQMKGLERLERTVIPGKQKCPEGASG